MKINKVIIAASCFWLVLILCAFYYLLVYQNKSIVSKSHPQSWPKSSSLSISHERPNLLMFLHPACPCSKASLAELDRLLSNFPNRLNVVLVFISPDSANKDWHKTSLWLQASGISGLDLFVDTERRETSLFNSKSSGEVLLYDRNGYLLYSGGLTASRGHQGDNIGRDSIEYYLQHGLMKHSSAPSFGCELFDSSGHKS